MKFAVIAAAHLSTAIVSLLVEKGYKDKDFLEGDNITSGFILVNTDSCTFKHRDTTTRATVLNPATQYQDIVTMVTAGSRATAPGTVAAAPAAPAFAVGDRVTATNLASTKDKFKLDTDFTYTVNRITPTGKIGLAGLPNDEYLAKRFTKVTGTADAAAAVTGAYAASSAPVATTTDGEGNTLSVGDYVLVVSPTRRDGRFALTPNKVEKITVITAKGNIGFGGADQYSPKRFVKVSLEEAAGNVDSGDLVIAIRDGKHLRNANNVSKFALPLFTAIPFRGVTVQKGNFILDGYAEHQYSPSRFQKVVRA